MGHEKPQEQLSHEPKSSTEYAADAVNNIRLLDNLVDIDKTFPRMSELMDVADNHKTFQQISDLSQICQWQNAAVDRKNMIRYCSLLDTDA